MQQPLPEEEEPEAVRASSHELRRLPTARCQAGISDEERAARVQAFKQAERRHDRLFAQHQPWNLIYNWAMPLKLPPPLPQAKPPAPQPPKQQEQKGGEEGGREEEEEEEMVMEDEEVEEETSSPRPAPLSES
jgi:hypothetical protein